MSTRHLIVVAALSAAIAACNSQPKEDPRIAELQKQLADTKQELAATKDKVDAATTTAVEGASQAQAATQSAQQALRQSEANAADQSAATREANERAAQAAEQAGRDRAATQRLIADQQREIDQQKAAAAKQAQEAERTRRELEEMKPKEFTLRAGTTIPVRTTSEVSTKTMANGSTFEALLDRDLVVDGTTLAKKGAKVSCVVVSADPGGRVKGVASISVAAKSIAGVNGNTLTIATNEYSTEAGSTRGRDAKRTGIAAGAGAVIGAIAGGGKGAAIGAGAGAAAGVGANMATRGEPAVIPTETLIEFALTSSSTVVFRK